MRGQCLAKSDKVALVHYVCASIHPGWHGSGRGDRPVLELVDGVIVHIPEFCNGHCAREGIGNVTPADVYYGWRKEILRRREEQKRETLYERFQYHLGQKTNRATSEPEVQNRSLLEGINHSQRC